MGQKRLGMFAVAMLLALAVGTARAQPGLSPAERERAANSAKAMNDSLDAQFDAISAVVSFAIFGVVVAGFVVAAAVGTRWYLRMQAPSDPNQLAMDDPWVREHLSRKNAAGPPPGRPPAGE
jgi:hypothetical protein